MFSSKLTTYLIIVLHRIWNYVASTNFSIDTREVVDLSPKTPVSKQLLDKYFNSKCLALDLLDPINLYNISNIATTTVIFLSKKVRMLGYKQEMASEVYNVALPSWCCKKLYCYFLC